MTTGKACKAPWPGSGCRRGSTIETPSLPLDEQVALEADENGDHFLMRLLCVQLFSLGRVEDSLRVWRAKSCNFDTHGAIDVQLVCGAGLETTRAYLRQAGEDDAAEALQFLARCEAAGDFKDFSSQRLLDQARAFYQLAEPRQGMNRD